MLSGIPMRAQSCPIRLFSRSHGNEVVFHCESRAASAAEVGTFTDSFPFDGEEGFHLRACSRLFLNLLQFVLPEALAHRSHDEGQAPLSAIADVPASTQQLYDQRVSEIQVIPEGQFTEAESAEERLRSRLHEG